MVNIIRQVSLDPHHKTIDRFHSIGKSERSETTGLSLCKLSNSNLFAPSNKSFCGLLTNGVGYKFLPFRLITSSIDGFAKIIEIGLECPQRHHSSHVLWQSRQIPFSFKPFGSLNRFRNVACLLTRRVDRQCQENNLSLLGLVFVWHLLAS